MSRHLLAFLVLVAAALGLAGAAPGASAEGPKLVAEVGPGATISLRDAAGNRVTQLDPGPYEIEVKDMADEHNFHLSGPGVDRRTEVGFVGETTWQVTFQNGTYRFVCDPHATSMRGAFTVGTPPTPTPTPPAATPSAPRGAKLALNVGPGQTITLKTLGGKAVKVLKAGSYTFVVRDRSTFHNAHLLGAGVDRTTGVSFVGTRTWKLSVKKGTLAYRCDPHRTVMRGTVRIV